jgi:pseudouridine synthase
MRINKYLAQCNIASRRKCDELIAQGCVTVNGAVMTDYGYQVDEARDSVCVNGRAVALSKKNYYYMLNKPKGIISAAYSKYGEPTVVELIKEASDRLYPVGRLDKDSEGLIFLTNDGDFAYCVTHPKFGHAKKYEAVVKGRIDSKKIDKLKKGLTLDGRRAVFNDVRLIGLKNDASILSVTIKEGRNRQIRRMCEMIGHPVVSLKRVEECGIPLGELKAGEYRSLSKNEISKCKSAAMDSSIDRRQRGPNRKK